MPGLPHPDGRVVDQLVGQRVHRSLVDERLGRVVRRAVPAPAHDDGQAAQLRDPQEPGGVAADPGQREVREGGAAGLLEPGQLLEDHRLVRRQLPVVPAILDVPERALGVLVGKDEPQGRGVDRALDGHDVRHLACIVDPRRAVRGDPAPPPALRSTVQHAEGEMTERRDDGRHGRRDRGRRGPRVRLGVDGSRRTTGAAAGCRGSGSSSWCSGSCSCCAAVLPGARDRGLAAVPRRGRRVPRLVAGQPRDGFALPRVDHRRARGPGPARRRRCPRTSPGSGRCASASRSCSSRSSAA